MDKEVGYKSLEHLTNNINGDQTGFVLPMCANDKPQAWMPWSIIPSIQFAAKKLRPYEKRYRPMGGRL